MEESKLQALADSLSKHSGRKGLGTYGGEYSWSKTATSSTTTQSARDDGLPNNPLYSNFIKEGTYDPLQKTPLNHGDGRLIKRDFSDIPAIVDETSNDDETKKKKSSKKSKEERKAEKKALKKAAKKAAKLEAKKKAKLEEKRRLKKLAKSRKTDP
jgi:hypothetical protein